MRDLELEDDLVSELYFHDKWNGSYIEAHQLIKDIFKHYINFISFDEIGKALADKRRELKIEQKEIADKLGVCRTMISRYERGSTIMNINTIFKYVDALGLKLKMSLINNK